MKGVEGNKKLSLNTNALEAKINSVQVIKELVKNLGTTFYEYIEPTWTQLKNVFAYQYSKNVRENVWETCQYLIEACVDHSTKAALFRDMIPLFKDRVNHYLTKRDHLELTNLYNALLHCSKPFKQVGFIDEADVDWLFNSLGQAAWLCEIEKDQRKVQFEKDKPTLDEEDYKEFENTIDDIQKLGSNIMEISGKFMKLYKGEITPLVRKYLIKPFETLLYKQNKIQEETIDSCCFFIDVLENLDDQIFLEYY